MAPDLSKQLEPGPESLTAGFDPLLSIILVNWKAADLLRRCLQGIYGERERLQLEFIVVDNASDDGCAEMLRREFPDVLFIDLPQNAGFARANNRGAVRASADLLLFLNPDTEIGTGTLEAMRQVFGERPDAGVVGCRLLNSDGSVQTSCIKAFPSIAGEFLDSAWLIRHFPGWRLWGATALLPGKREMVPVDCISGACLMIPRRLFQAVGGFDDSYFMYSEDVDLCWKVRQAGWTNYFTAAGEVVHHGGASSAQRGRSFEIVIARQSRMDWFRRRRGVPHAVFYRAAMIVAALARLPVLFVLWLVSENKKPCSGMSKWYVALRWALGMEGWARQLARKPKAGAFAHSPTTDRAVTGD